MKKVLYAISSDDVERFDTDPSNPNMITRIHLKKNGKIVQIGGDLTDQKKALSEMLRKTAENRTLPDMNKFKPN